MYGWKMAMFPLFQCAPYWLLQPCHEIIQTMHWVQHEIIQAMHWTQHEIIQAMHWTQHEIIQAMHWTQHEIIQTLHWTLFHELIHPLFK